MQGDADVPELRRGQRGLGTNIGVPRPALALLLLLQRGTHSNLSATGELLNGSSILVGTYSGFGNL